MKNLLLSLAAVAALSFVGCGTGTEANSDELAATSEAELVVKPLGGKCGSKVCAAGTYCCNSSCGTCVPKGGRCLQRVCAASADE